MRKLGIVPERFTSELAIRLDDPKQLPPLYSTVVLKSKKKIGTITDIIGPTSAPWCVVKLKNKFVSVSIGEELYIVPDSQRKQNVPKKRRFDTNKEKQSSDGGKKINRGKRKDKHHQSTNSRYRRS